MEGLITVIGRSSRTSRSKYLYHVARSVLNDDAEAEDVVQKAYVRAFSTCDAVRSKGPL
ncbi:hypothetical protein C4E04_10440 [Microvirga sp. 17 mud 1-3]|nr:hypothetical protein C4E04_10440 [Microvirga sp. 17 mud 1-3]